MTVKERLREELLHIFEETGTISLSLCTVRDQEISWKHCFGLRNRERNEPTTLDTYYRMASVSKVVSGMAVMTLVDAGKVSLDADIGDYLGYRVRNPYFPDVPITLRQLMTHTSTLIETGSYNKICAGEMPPYLLSEVLKEGGPGYSIDNYLNARPGSAYSYSSFGSGIMGTIIEAITGMRFCDYATKAIFDPLGLTCRYDPADLPEGAVVATPYEVAPDEKDDRGEEWLKNSLKNKAKLYALPVGEAYRMAQGNLHAKPSEMARLMMLFFGGGVSQGVRVLSEESIAEMKRLQFDDGVNVHGLNLMLFDHRIVPDRAIIGHFGRAYGAFNAFFFDDETKHGVILCMNGTDAKSCSLGFTITCERMLRAVFPVLEQL
ncbi:MAG: serine hydrolase domain-containing protein [Christensenellales bacterium]|jgi:CubicO group peptidase (beta-lactamase class C family)